MLISLSRCWSAASLRPRERGVGSRELGEERAPDSPLRVLGMSLFARLLYRALVWKARTRTRWTSDAPGARAASGEPRHLNAVRGVEPLAYADRGQACYTLVRR